MTDHTAAIAALQRLADAAASPPVSTQVRVALGKDYDLVRAALAGSETPDPRPRQAGHIAVAYTRDGFALTIDGWQVPWAIRSIRTQLDGQESSFPSVVLDVEADRVTLEHSLPWPRSCSAGTSCMLPLGHEGPHQPVRFERDERGELAEVTA